MSGVSTPLLKRYTPPVSDAGLQSLDHYKRILPPWRYRLRQRLLPLIRWETPHLAWLQERVRTPALDTYFAISANLGTTLAFLIILPPLFWSGQTYAGRGMVHIILLGVVLTGILKDLLSLPRPLSPPLHRISMSNSAVLEYGFPSTHSANAIAVVSFAWSILRKSGTELGPVANYAIHTALYIYALTIVIGRLYCGMHGFLDVACGSIMGIALTMGFCFAIPIIDGYIYGSSWTLMATIVFVSILMIQYHPEPADDCPCFDDSIASIGCIIGIEVGGWHYASSGWALSQPVPATVPYSLKELGWSVTLMRIAFGIVVLILWKETMKPTLLKSLPPLFRAIEYFGLDLPRKFFKPASQYKIIPARLKMDNLMPSFSDLPALVKGIRNTRRGRCDSVGPQSAADAYEALAYREKKRRDSLQSESGEKGSPRDTDNAVPKTLHQSSMATGAATGPGALLTPAQSRVGSYERMMGQVSLQPPAQDTPPRSDAGEEDEDRAIARDAAEIFSKIQKPRVRYDVEVVAKLVIYIGIGWLVAEIVPILFECVGLGTGNGYLLQQSLHMDL